MTEATRRPEGDGVTVLLFLNFSVIFFIESVFANGEKPTAVAGEALMP